MRSGQAIVFTLMFLIPMIVAMGLLMRVDSTINLRIRLQDATDAAAQEGGAQVARVMNQIAVHNMAIVKYHALQAATKTAQKAAEVTVIKVTSEIAEATKALTCWQGKYTKQQACCTSLCVLSTPCCEDPQACEKAEASLDCVKRLQEQLEIWNKILTFWQGEERFFQQQSQSFESELGRMTRQLGQKSDGMVTQLDDQLKDLYTRIGKEHRLHINSPETNKQWVTSADGQRPMKAGQWDKGKVFKKGRLSDYEQIGMKATENGRQETDRGIFNFEGPPPQVSGEMADKKKAGKQVNPPWGPTRYYMEYIYSVHIGLPGYFKFDKMHGPLGNPDTKNPSCGGGNHPGAEETKPIYQQAKEDCQVDPCHRDWKEYSAEYFHARAEEFLPGISQQEFSGSDIVYQLAQTPKLEFLVSGRIEADQGYFNRLFKARTVDMADDGARDGSQSYLHALAKFELYNLTETNGTILSRGQYGQYAKALLTQDWNALMTPIVREEVQQEREIIRNNMVH